MLDFGHDPARWRVPALLAAAGSAALLLGALGFQYLGGLAPCPLCIWQRWPHGIAVALGLVVLLAGRRLPPALGRAVAAAGALAMLAGAGIALYHTGIERHWWAGPSSCTSAPVGGLDPDRLLERIMAAPLVRCDEVAWSFLGLSMASWNGLASLALAGLWLLALRRA